MSARSLSTTYPEIPPNRLAGHLHPEPLSQPSSLLLLSWLVAPLLIGVRTVHQGRGTCPRPPSRRPPRSGCRTPPGWPPGRSREGRPPPRSPRQASRRRGGRAGGARGPGTVKIIINLGNIFINIDYLFVLIHRYQDIERMRCIRQKSFTSK